MTNPISDQNYIRMVQSGDLCRKAQTIYRMLYKVGKATTRELAGLTGIALWTVRPRCTEMRKAGLIKEVERRKGEGVYACAAWLSREGGERAATRVEQPRVLTKKRHLVADMLPGFGGLT